MNPKQNVQVVQIEWNKGEGMDKHFYPQGDSICQCVGQCACENSAFVCDFRAGRMRRPPL